MAASSSMTRTRGFNGSVDLDGVEGALAAVELGLVEIQRVDVARAGAGGQAPVVVDAAHRLAVHFEDDVAALDVGIEGGTERLDARHDHSLDAVGQPEAF